MPGLLSFTVLSCFQSPLQTQLQQLSCNEWPGSIPWFGKIPWSKEDQHSSILPKNAVQSITYTFYILSDYSLLNTTKECSSLEPLIQINMKTLSFQNTVF